jgi:hypothetical protein
METEVAMEVVEREQEFGKLRRGDRGDRPLRKYAYVLPSGRRVIVVVDDESELAVATS